MPPKSKQTDEDIAAEDEDLYAVLQVPRDANAAVIKKAYLKLARETHPDRCPGDEDAKARFQAIGRAYATLSDAEKRQVYDTSGIVDDAVKGSSGWYDFWRDFYTRVTTDKLEEAAATYRGSEEEEADLRAAYKEAKGSMEGVLDRMDFATADDEPRFRERLEKWVADGSLPKHKAFASEPEAKKRRRQAKAAKEAEEAEELKRKLGLGGGGDLTSAIVARQAQRRTGGDDFLASLAERFGGEGGSKKKGKGAKGGKAAAMSADGDPLAGDAFEAAQAKMLSKTKAGKR
jgi:DnaJ family protein C protein 9